MLLKQQVAVRQIKNSSVSIFSMRSNVAVGLFGCTRSKQTKADRLPAHLLWPFTSPSGNTKGRVTDGKSYAFHDASTWLGSTLIGFETVHLSTVGLYPINFTRDKPSQNQQKALSDSLSREPIIHFLSVHPFLSSLTFSSISSRSGILLLCRFCRAETFKRAAH